MRELGSFKRWFSIQQATAVLQSAFGEHVMESDLLEHVNAGHIPVWWDATERYAVPVARGSHCFGMRAEQPLANIVRPLSPQRREQWFRQSECVQLLDGVYRIAFDARRDREELFVGERAGKIVFSDGVLLRDRDGESLLQVLKRMPSRPSGSSDAKDFIVDLEFPTPECFRIANADLRALLNAQTDDPDDQPAQDVGPKERETLLKQIGVLAMLLSEKSHVFRRGDKPNASQIAEAVEAMVSEMPDANTHGLGRSNIRANITEGLTFYKK